MTGQENLVSLSNVELMEFPNGLCAVIHGVKQGNRNKACGCWIIELNHGHAFVPCGIHEEAIMKIMMIKPILPDAKSHEA